MNISYYNKDMSSDATFTVTESMELPITTGTIYVDTSKGPITIFMKSPHVPGETLTISKTSNDNNMISLFSETILVNNADIIMFGLPSYAKVRKGKVKTLVLKGDNINWKIIRED
jgi:hypothetical protein